MDEVSSQDSAPASLAEAWVGAGPAGPDDYTWPADNAQNVDYLGFDGHQHELTNIPGLPWNATTLTALAHRCRRSRRLFRTQ